ncbi:MAG: O-antigen ligase family protein [Patescibacteria group bacterium]|nr:O-antigen ligase family protein [Patescibacteria group bacterium]MDD5164165.1 O-antigen ligase family protein [Patescibacteria group bacterium]MDD5534501.1 O-antigen ligase family protein [Patescibacteria group bacterium]
MSKISEKICLTIIHYGSYLILFLPLLVYQYTLYPYIFGKIIFFRILVEIIFAAWLFLAIYNKNYRPDWKNPLVFSLTAFMGVLVLTMFTGIDISRSFWSTQERMTGVLTLLHFWAWFLTLTSCFKKWQDWRKLIWASLICSFLVGLYGLGQKIGLKFLLQNDGASRMAATLGNSIFLAVYAMLHIFLAGSLIILEKVKLGKIFSFLILLLNFGIMLWAASRGVLGAFGLSFLLLLSYLIFTLRTKRLKLIFIPIFILLILILVGGVFFCQTQKGKLWTVKAPVFIHRIVYLTGGVEERTIAWNAGWQSFKEKPILGWGWENYNIIFNKYYNPYYLSLGQGNTWFDRSHNQVVDLLALTGGVGIMAYLAVFGVIFWLLLRKRNTNKYKICGVLFACMFFAYFIQNLTVFDTPAPLIVFYFSLALVYFITTNKNLEKPEARNSKFETNLKLKNQNSKSNQLPLPIFIFLIIIFLPWSIYKFNLEPFIQSKAAVVGISASRVDLKAGLDWYKKSLDKSVFTNPEIRTQLAKTIVEFPGQSNLDPMILQNGTDFVIKEFEKSIQEHPRDVRNYLYLGQLYNLGSKYNKTYLDRAEEILKKATGLSPKRQQVYFELGRTHLYKKEYEKSANTIQEAVNFDNKIGESYWNLATTYLIWGKNQEAAAAINKAYGELHYYKEGMDFNIARAYAEIKDFENAFIFCGKIVDQQSDNLTSQLGCALIYAKGGNQGMAEKIFDEIENKNPQAVQQVRQLLEQ